jgi:hypothetical protein
MSEGFELQAPFAAGVQWKWPADFLLCVSIRGFSHLQAASEEAQVDGRLSGLSARGSVLRQSKHLALGCDAAQNMRSQWD